MGKGTKSKTGLGRSLMKSRITRETIHNPDGSIRHTTVIDETTANNMRMQSITQENDLDAFITSVQLAETDFIAERQNVAFVDPSASVSSSKNPFLLTADQEKIARTMHEERTHLLTVPRRPKWGPSTTKEQLKRLENEAFLDWRRSLVYLEEKEGLLMTPYERNAEVWRQLWRVVERSDIVVQIVDARNPLLFRSADLEAYVTESHPLKKNILLINKADMLTNAQRLAWADYFDSQGVIYYFFSAAIAGKKHDLEMEQELIAKHKKEEDERLAKEEQQANKEAAAASAGFANAKAGGAFDILMNGDDDDDEDEEEDASDEKEKKDNKTVETVVPTKKAAPVTSRPQSEDDQEVEEDIPKSVQKKNKKKNKFGALRSANSVQSSTTNAASPITDFDGKPAKRKNKAALLDERLKERVAADQHASVDGLSELKSGAISGLKPSRVSLMISSVYNEQEASQADVRARILSTDDLLDVLHKECPEALPKIDGDGNILFGQSQHDVKPNANATKPKAYNNKNKPKSNGKLKKKNKKGLEAEKKEEETKVEDETEKVVFGFVGYPNVGKSSTLNALCGAKRVTVSSTPGKTKHFQTIHLTDGIVLCDCPGLVFPSFATTKAELVCNGILPIDQLREYTGPSQLVAERVPRDLLESVYGIQIFTFSPEGYLEDRQPTSEELLQSYAVARGYTKSSQGNPDEARAARYILKDFINGKLLFSHPPPGVDAREFNAPTYQLERVRSRFPEANVREVHTI